MIDLICTVIAFACAVGLATLCSRLRNENEQLLKWLEEADLKRGKIVDTLLTDRRRLERELEQAQKDLERKGKELKQECGYYVDLVNAIQCPDRIEVIDYGTHYEVSGADERVPIPAEIHSYSYDPEDPLSKAYAKNLAEELAEKLKEKAI